MEPRELFVGNGGQPRRDGATKSKSKKAASADGVSDPPDAMVADLARNLRVSEQSLRDIGIVACDGVPAFPERDSDGVVLGYCRRMPNGAKRVRKNESRGIYITAKLPELPDPVLIVEGASDTAAALTMGLTAVGRPNARGGADALATLLPRRDIIVVGERDQKRNGSWPGCAGAIAVAQKLADAWRKPVRWALPPEGAKDVREFTCVKGTTAGPELLTYLESHAETTEPQAFAAIVRFKPFPLNVLPPVMRLYIEAHANAKKCDPSFIAVPLLAAIASAIGNTRRIAINSDWAEPCILWTGIVGESGTQKSPALDAATRFVKSRQHKTLKTHAAELEQYKIAAMQYDVAFAEWKKRAGKGGAGEPPEKPPEPVAERTWTDDATLEAMVEKLRENPRGVLMARDELSGWFSFDRYSAVKGGAEVAKWLEIFGGRSLVVDRKTSGTSYVPRAAVSITGGIQPGALRRAIGTANRENGLLARLFFTMPPRRKRQWTDAEVSQSANASMEWVFDALYALAPDADAEGDDKPRDLPLSPEAREVFRRFVNEHGAEQFEHTGDAAALFSKLEGGAARLALVIHLTRWADSKKIDPDAIDHKSMAAGIMIARWFTREALRVYAMLGEDEADTENRRLLDWIEARGGVVTARELTQSNRKFRRNSSGAADALKRLADSGFGEWKPRAGGRTFEFTLAECVYVNGSFAGDGNNAESVDADSEFPRIDAHGWGAEGAI